MITHTFPLVFDYFWAIQEGCSLSPHHYHSYVCACFLLLPDELILCHIFPDINIWYAHLLKRTSTHKKVLYPKLFQVTSVLNTQKRFYYFVCSILTFSWCHFISTDSLWLLGTDSSAYASSCTLILKLWFFDNCSLIDP